MRFRAEHDDTCVRDEYDLLCLGYDPWNARQLVEEQLRDSDGIVTEPIRQGYKSLSGPCKEFERMVASRSIMHGNNPVLNWMVRHCIVDEDPAGNIKPNKKKSRHKIDGIASAVMALAVLQTRGQVWSVDEIGL